MAWPKDIVRWEEHGRWHLSIPFTWLLPKAADFCLRHDDCLVGGPAVKLMPEYINQYAEIGPDRNDMLRRYNPQATRTTQGCKNACPYCGVRKIEGSFRELPNWEVKPVLIDSNFLQCSDAHFDAVCDSLQDVHHIDFNQGLDASLFTGYRAERLAELSLKYLRFAWDTAGDEDIVLQAIDAALSFGIARSRISVYSLVGWDESPEEALSRMLTLRALRVWTFPMRYQPVDALRKNNHCPPQWNNRDLRWFVKFWNRQIWLGGAEFEWPSKGPQMNIDFKQDKLPPERD